MTSFANCFAKALTTALCSVNELDNACEYFGLKNQTVRKVVSNSSGKEPFSYFLLRFYTIDLPHRGMDCQHIPSQLSGLHGAQISCLD